MTRDVAVSSRRLSRIGALLRLDPRPTLCGTCCFCTVTRVVTAPVTISHACSVVHAPLGLDSRLAQCSTGCSASVTRGIIFSARIGALLGPAPRPIREAPLVRVDNDPMLLSLCYDFACLVVVSVQCCITRSCTRCYCPSPATSHAWLACIGAAQHHLFGLTVTSESDPMSLSLYCDFARLVSRIVSVQGSPSCSC